MRWQISDGKLVNLFLMMPKLLRFLSELMEPDNLDRELLPRPKCSKDFNLPIVSGTDTSLLL